MDGSLPTVETPHPYWGFAPHQFRSPQQVAWVFNIYRFCLSGLLFILFHLNSTFPALGQLNTNLFYVTMVGYIGFSLLSLLTTNYQPRRFRARIFVQVLLDIVLLTTMMHCSSMRNGFGILINAAIAGGSLLIGGRIAYLLAGIASLAVCLEQLINQYAGGNQASLLSESGLLTATFFATALISYELSTRVKASVDLAHQQQDAIEELAELNSQIISRLPVGALVVTPEGRLLLSNTRAQTIFADGAEQDMLLSSVNPQLMQWYEQWRDQQFQHRGNLTLQLNQRDYDCQFSVLSNDLQPNALIILEDKSRLFQQAQQMKLASLGQFSASIAHEIRNPVGAISHAAQLLQENQELADEDAKLVGIIQKQTQRVNTVVENVLQLSRRQQSVPEWINLHVFMTEFIQSTHFAEYPNAQICLDIGENWPSVDVLMDASQLSQVLMNLCNNGLRYSTQAKGNPIITCKLIADYKRHSILIDIIDQGQGVAAENINRLFEPFYTTERSGTGLGLYLVKELAEMNDIDVQYCADYQGGCFRLRFFQIRMSHA